MKTDWAAALWTGLSFALALVVGSINHLWADAGRLFAFRLSVTLVILAFLRLWRRDSMSVLGLFCLGANLLLAVILGYRLFLR